MIWSNVAMKSLLHRLKARFRPAAPRAPQGTWCQPWFKAFSLGAGLAWSVILPAAGPEGHLFNGSKPVWYLGVDPGAFQVCLDETFEPTPSGMTLFNVNRFLPKGEREPFSFSKGPEREGPGKTFKVPVETQCRVDITPPENRAWKALKGQFTLTCGVGRNQVVAFVHCHWKPTTRADASPFGQRLEIPLLDAQEASPLDLEMRVTFSPESVGRGYQAEMAGSTDYWHIVPSSWCEGWCVIL